MENFIGTIVEESLQDKGILQKVRILETSVEPITEDDNTPWLKQWTMHRVEIPAEQSEDVAEELARALETEHTCWYADFRNDAVRYVIFPGKVFKVNRAKQDENEAVKQYARSRGIPEHQLDWK